MAISPSTIPHKEPNRALWQAAFAPGAQRFAVAALVASFFMPLSGIGIDLCPLHALTHLPCPGCGMTRAISMLSQGDWRTAAGANPFVFVLWPVLIAMAIMAIIPRRFVARLEARLLRAEPFVSGFARVSLFGFLGFGLVRLVTFAVLREPFP